MRTHSNKPRPLKFDIRGNLIRFLESKARNEWLQVKTDAGITIDVYVRKSRRVFPDYYGSGAKSYGAFFDIASITVDFQNRRKGAFKEFLFKLKTAAQDMKYDGIYVENIVNPDLYSYLVKKEGFRTYGLESAFLIFAEKTPNLIPRQYKIEMILTDDLADDTERPDARVVPFTCDGIKDYLENTLQMIEGLKIKVKMVELIQVTR